MKYNVNPKNGDKLSVLGYGCMRFGDDSIAGSFTGRFDAQKAENLIVSAVEQGINYFDTAYVIYRKRRSAGQHTEKTWSPG